MRWKSPCSLQFVVEKGWGDMADQDDPDVVLRREEEKTWEVIKEVAPDASVFNVLSYPKLYHNLKAAIKEVCTEARNPNIFYDDCQIPGEEMLRIVENREFSRLPSHMGNVAQEALETLLHTRDGQLCDIMNPVNRSLKIMQIQWLLLRISRLPCVPGKREKALISCEALWRSVMG